MTVDTKGKPGPAFGGLWYPERTSECVMQTFEVQMVPRVRRGPKFSAAEHSVQWTGGYAPRFLDVFVALSFSRFDGASRPAHLPLTRAVSPSSISEIN
jgi:hypothetical protein